MSASIHAPPGFGLNPLFAYRTTRNVVLRSTLINLSKCKSFKAVCCIVWTNVNCSIYDPFQLNTYIPTYICQMLIAVRFLHLTFIKHVRYLEYVILNDVKFCFYYILVNQPYVIMGPCHLNFRPSEIF